MYVMQGEDHADGGEKPWGPRVSGMNETEWGISVGKPLDDFEEVGHDLT